MTVELITTRAMFPSHLRLQREEADVRVGQTFLSAHVAEAVAAVRSLLSTGVYALTRDNHRLLPYGRFVRADPSR